MPDVMIITISGEHGAGKSTIARMLAFRTGWARMSTGDTLREWSKDPSLNPKKLPFQKWYEQLKPELDGKADNEIKTAAQTKERLVLEGRMTFNFIPHEKHSLKVFLSVNPEIAAQRVFQQKQQDAEIRKEEKPYKNVEEALKDMEKRKQTEIERYETLYGVNPSDLKYYDLVLDTSYQTPDEIVEQILQAAQPDKGTSTYADL